VPDYKNREVLKGTMADGVREVLQAFDADLSRLVEVWQYFRR
jgi:hypothetical protein